MTIKSSVEKEKNEVELIVEIESEELNTAVNKAYIKNRNRIAVPGFRKGKAPRKMIERLYGAEIFHSDALDDLIPDALRFVMKETELDVVGYPKVSDVDIKENNASAEITFIVALRPEVLLGEYKGLTAPKPTIEIPDSEIDAEIASIRARNARIEKTDRPAGDGDIAVIDFEGFVDGVAFEGGKGENYELELGNGQFIPGFEDKVVGMTTGEERDLDLVFPENYKEDLAGKAVVFKVKLNEVKEKILPELDDDFAMDVSEFDTLEEYKTDIRDNLLKTRQRDADETFESILMEQITDSMEADIPEAMIDEQFEHSMNTLSRQISAYGMQPAQYMRMMGVTPEEFKERMRGNCETQVKTALALEKIAQLEGIEVTEEEIAEEYDEASKRLNTELEKLKESVTDKDVIRDLKLRKAAKLVVENAVVGEYKADEPKEKSAKKPAAKKPVAKKPAAEKAKASAKKAAPKETKPEEEA